MPETKFKTWLMIKKISAFVLIMIIVTSVHAQVTVRSKMPSKENTLLIDSLIRVTNYQLFFHNYCVRQIKTVAKRNNWTVEHIDSIMSKITFEDFKSNFYYVFASYSKEDLTKMIHLFSSINSNNVKSLSDENWTAIVPINQVLENNLEVYVNARMGIKWVDIDR